MNEQHRARHQDLVVSVLWCGQSDAAGAGAALATQCCQLPPPPIPATKVGASLQLEEWEN